jgi:hypothetical protein
MSLFYPASEQVYRGKTAEQEDRFTARFVELTPPTRIVGIVNLTVPLCTVPAWRGILVP